MNVVLFCSKVSLASSDIFDVYEKEGLKDKILSILHGVVSSDIVYEEADEFLNDNGEKIVKTIRYKLSINEKTNTYIYGHLCKDSELYYKTFNEKTRQSERHTTPYTETVLFYFDVYKEIIVFHTANRLGYRNFNDAMMGIFNKAMEINSYPYRFEIVLLTEGLKVAEIENTLKSIHNIYELKFNYQAPNPDSDTLARIKENGEGFIDSMEEANATRISQIFSTKGGKGLNVDSYFIKESIDNIKGMSSIVGDTKAFAKGYISVEVTDARGKKYTTAESKPVKTIVNSLNDFVNSCKRIIAELF